MGIASYILDALFLSYVYGRIVIHCKVTILEDHQYVQLSLLLFPQSPLHTIVHIHKMTNSSSDYTVILPTFLQR